MNNKRYNQRIVVTGGAGFIGSNLLLKLVPAHSDSLFVNIDSLTYAGNLSNLHSLESCENYQFEKLDIRDKDALKECFERVQPTGLIHLAAESHVDRSIIGPSAFVETNIIGTFNLLEIARHTSKDRSFRFHHVSTDEVFGSLGSSGAFTETTPYKPNSPYSASKASSDHLVRAYHKTYGLDVVTSNCSNNYGPYQFPEKLLPLMIHNAKNEKPLPIYGDGKQIRDWLYVEDHCEALYEVFTRGLSGQTYNIGGNNEIENIELVRLLCKELDKRLGGGPREDLLTFVEDRPGHDRRYAIDASKIKDDLGWEPRVDFEKGLSLTIDWYLNNEQWLTSCMSGEYKTYYDTMYSNREVR